LTCRHSHSVNLQVILQQLISNLGDVSNRPNQAEWARVTTSHINHLDDYYATEVSRALEVLPDDVAARMMAALDARHEDDPPSLAELGYLK
jgi:hypothetical protein